MKSGNAVSVHDDDAPQIVTAIASPAGRDANRVMPIHATPARVRPIQTPLPRIRNSETISSVVIQMSFIDYSLCSISSVVTCLRRPRISRTSSSMNAISSTTVPTAIEICGIHSGVASLPVEMSLNDQDW